MGKGNDSTRQNPTPMMGSVKGGLGRKKVELCRAPLCSCHRDVYDVCDVQLPGEAITHPPVTSMKRHVGGSSMAPAVRFLI